MLTLYVMCGIPGSGKTILSKQLAETESLVRFSYDEMHCFDLKDLMKPAVEALQDGKSIIVDNVNNRLRGRELLLDFVKDIPCKKILIFMNTPLEECLKRNVNRQNRLPDYFIEGIHRSMQLPTINEGWDEIIYV